MKFAYLLDWAKHNQRNTPSATESSAARRFIELLGEAQPCGMEPPPVISLGNGECGVLVDDRGDALTVDEGRAYAAMVLRACDEAEERNT